MEKMLSKSRSRFFGKKKSSKNLGISSSDPPAPEPERLVNENYSGPSTRPTPPPSTPRTDPDIGASALRPNVSPGHLHHAGSSSTGAGHPMGLHGHEKSASSFSRPSHLGSISQSRFQVHISPTAFSPIIIPSSTSQASVTTSPSKHRDISVLGSKNGVTNVEHTPQVGEGFTHGRSQSSMSPNETPASRARSRRHAIPANFLESVGAASGGMKSLWNGQSLEAEQYINSQNPRDKSPSSFPSQPAFMHPSASAPVTSCLSNTETCLVPSELAPIPESKTEPATNLTSSSSGRTPLPRSVPSYNLAGLTPSSSGTTGTIDPRRIAEVGQRPAARSHRSDLSQPPISETVHRPQHSSPQPPSSSSPTREREATITKHQSSNRHRMSPSMGSEMEIGYKGLAFPLPPSSEEGLAMSYSSSQSSLFSTVSARRSGDQPSTPRTTRDGKLRGDYAHDTRPPGGTESCGAMTSSGSSARDRNTGINMNENRTNPTPDARITMRNLDGATEDFEPAHKNGLDIRGGDIRRQDRVAKELEGVLGIKAQQDRVSDDTYLPTRVRAVSETSRPHPAGARPQKQPEPTKPLVLNSSRKTLHTARSFTTLMERKQLQPSSSSQDLAGALNSASSRSERVRTPTAIPVRIGPGVQRDRDTQPIVSVAPIQTQRSEDQTSIPPSFPLPTPPNSSSALSLLAHETKSTEDVPSHPHVDMGMPPSPYLTLKEVMEALRAQQARFEELSSYVLDVTQRHTTEKEAYVGRVGRLEDTVAKLEREIHGLRWLVLENTRARRGAGSDAGLILDAAVAAEEDSSRKKNIGGNTKSVAIDRTLRRSSTMPQLPTLTERPGHVRNKRFGGLGLEFSPESTESSPITLSSLATPPRFEVDMGDEEHTPSMDEIIDKLMAVRQWAGSDVRVSVIESAGGVGDSKRIVFRQV